MFKCLLLSPAVEFHSDMIKAKLYMNVHWMVLYKLYVFCSDVKFKLAATAGLSLTLDHMGKMFQNASCLRTTWTIESNFLGMIIGRFYKIYVFQVVSEKKRFETFFPRVQC